MLQVKCRIWMEQDGKPVFGDGRVRLLEAIADTGSLAAAARTLRMPYRTAWQHVNLMERAYGRPLVERHPGGPTGGVCRLTKAGRDLLAAYREFREGVDDLLARRFRRVMGGAPRSSLPKTV